MEDISRTNDPTLTPPKLFASPSEEEVYAKRTEADCKDPGADCNTRYLPYTEDSVFRHEGVDGRVIGVGVIIVEARYIKTGRD